MAANGRFNTVAGVVVAGLSILAVIAAMVGVGFQTTANSTALAAQAIILDKQSIEIKALQLMVNTQATALNEIETQFCATDVIRNLMHANDQRLAAILYEKTFGTKWPTDNAYYPTICNRRTK